jgi:carbamoyl-phosphate synthase large subunit
MKPKILISGAGGSLFPYVFQTLEEKYDLTLVDSNNIIKKIYPNKNILTVPLVKEESFSNEMIRILKENKIDYYIPLIDEEIPIAHEISSQIENLKLISPKIEFVNLCLNKIELMQKLQELNLSNIKTTYANNLNIDSSEISFPLFLKPNEGRGSRGIKKINNKEEFDAYFISENYSKDQVIVQEFLTGTEFTVSVVVNNKNQLIAIVPKRVIVKKGVTLHAVTERNIIIEKACKKIVEKLEACGSFNVQLIISNNEVKIFEINPRYSTTTILTCQAGINEFELNIKHFDDNQIDIIDQFKENIYLYRRWESCFYE